MTIGRYLNQLEWPHIVDLGGQAGEAGTEIPTGSRRLGCRGLPDLEEATREPRGGVREQGQTYKVKHSRYSQVKLADARAAMAMVHTIADDFACEIATLCATTVTPTHWESFLDAHVPRLHAGGQPLKGRSLTSADRKREALTRLYRYDDRVAPWAGTAQGVVKAVNTYEHHESTVRGATRPERNMLRAVTGDFGRLDRNTLETLQRVLT